MTTEFKGRGPIPADIVIVGEAWGREEDEKKTPFVGAAGRELLHWLKYAKLTDKTIRFTNVVNERPTHNDFGSFCCPKREAELAYDRRNLPESEHIQWPERYTWKGLGSGKYLHPSRLYHLAKLYDEIAACQPRVIVPVGNTACWAILGKTGINKIRGSVFWSDTFGTKVIPTLHPAAILRNYENQPLAIVDMVKVCRELETTEIIRPEREIWLDPSLDDIRRFNDKIQTADQIGCDIETKGGFVTMVGFSINDSAAICIPFYDPRRDDGNYWATPDAEIEAWRWVRYWLSTPQPKIFQNGAYDVSWLWAIHGIPVLNWDDTLLQAHAIQPELPKDLGTLGSIFTNERNWKTTVRHRSDKDNE